MNEITQHFENLKVYQNAMDLVEHVYALIKRFPPEERYALCDQLRRAIVSVPSNIAEGMNRYSNKEKVHFLEISYASLMESYCQLSIAKRLGYITEDELTKLSYEVEAVAKPLSGLRRSFLPQNTPDGSLHSTL